MKRINFERILSKSFLVVLSVVLVLLSVDTISTWFLKARRSPIERKFQVDIVREPKPYVMFGGKPFGKIWKKQLNELGYREEAPSLHKDPKEFRVIVLGGSAAFMGVPSIARLTQYQFEKQGCQNIKFYNFGVVSSVTGMELARIVFEVVDYQPDLILSYSGFNDVDQPFVMDPRPGYPFNFIVYENNPLLESTIDTYPRWSLIAYGSNLMRYFFPSYFVNKFTDLRNLRQKEGYLTEAWQDKLAQGYVNNMIKSYKISKAFDADFMAFFQPSLYYKDVTTKKEQKHVNPRRRDNLFAVKNKIEKKMAMAQRKTPLPYVDLSNAYDSVKETVFVDRVHTRPFYKPMIAKIIHQHLLGYFKEKGFEENKYLQCYE